jgi:hypothetical protein
LTRATATIAASIIVFSAVSAMAAGGKMNHVYGIGTKSCGYFIDAVDNELKSQRSQDNEFEMLSWAQGYLSQFNVASPSTENILGGTDSEGMAQWLKNYCRASPLKPFSVAVDALIDASWSSRITSPQRK